MLYNNNNSHDNVYGAVIMTKVPVLKTVYRSSRRDKHNCQRRDSNLDPLTPQSDALTARYWDKTSDLLEMPVGVDRISRGSENVCVHTSLICNDLLFNCTQMLMRASCCVRFHCQVEARLMRHTAVQCLAVLMPLHQSLLSVTMDSPLQPLYPTMMHLCIPM